MDNFFEPSGDWRLHLEDELQQELFQERVNDFHIVEEGDCFAVYRGTIRVSHPTPLRFVAERDLSYHQSFSYKIFPYSDGTYHPKWRYQQGTWYHFCDSDNQYKICKSLAEARLYMRHQCIEAYTVSNEIVSID